jgi:hypothetical protein
MYFKGVISVDPSQITKIKKVQPKRAFRRMLYSLTLGKISDKEEHETFTAVSILQQIYLALKEMKIDNIIRLRHNDLDFYHDNEGKKNDLQEAMDSYELEIDEAMSEVFKQLSILLEHEDNYFKYLIEIDINRTHKVGEYPIVLKVSGLIKDFKSSSKNGVEGHEEGVRSKLEGVMGSQDSFNSYITVKEGIFNLFLENLNLAIKKSIHIDDSIVKLSKKVLVNKDEKATLNDLKNKQ